MEHQQQRPQSWRDRVLEWEMGLPSAEDLTPLSQTLIPPELASAFSISTEPFRDVRRSSNHTVPSLRSITDAEENLEDQDQELDQDDADGAGSGGSKKRARLVWTPQLHRRFVEVVGHLGIKNAVPKTIVQMMNVEGLTRENVASHLQKYRLYVKRMQAGGGGAAAAGEGPSSSSDALFSSLPLPPAMVPVSWSMYQGNWGFHGNEFQSSGGGNMFG